VTPALPSGFKSANDAPSPLYTYYHTLLVPGQVAIELPKCLLAQEVNALLHKE